MCIAMTTIAVLSVLGIWASWAGSQTPEWDAE